MSSRSWRLLVSISPIKIPFVFEDELERDVEYNMIRYNCYCYLYINIEGI
jgi:hypothetical protein